ncbi:MAG: hypothetical protein SGILL_009145 [Bacillariaceae sp.]
MSGRGAGGKGLGGRTCAFDLSPAVINRAVIVEGSGGYPVENGNNCMFNGDIDTIGLGFQFLDDESVTLTGKDDLAMDATLFEGIMEDGDPTVTFVIDASYSPCSNLSSGKGLAGTLEGGKVFTMTVTEETSEPPPKRARSNPCQNGFCKRAVEDNCPCDDFKKFRPFQNCVDEKAPEVPCVFSKNYYENNCRKRMLRGAGDEAEE